MIHQFHATIPLSLCLLLLLGWTSLPAQNIEAKLSGTSSAESFKVKDKNGRALFSVFGDARISIGTSTPGAAQLIVDAEANLIPVLVGGTSSEAGLLVVNKSTVGTASGITAIISAANGTGIYGVNNAISGSTAGIFGRSMSPDGAGIRGEGSVGVFGTAGQNAAGRGVYGFGLTGVHGKSDYETGVRGEGVTGVSGKGTTGVYGFSNVPSGKAIHGNSSAWAGYFDGFAYFSSNVGIATLTPVYKLHVNGSAGKPGGGSWTNASDIRLKDIDGNYQKGLDEIVKLQPIRFHYKENNTRGYSSERDEIGFIAQEVQKVFPEAVSEGDDGYLDMNVHAINVAAVNAIRELHELVTKLEKKLSKQDAEIKELHKLLDKQHASR
jgi:endosialidase-like protein